MSMRVQGRGRVAHDRPVDFTFDGRSYEGRAGDSVASALMANGVALMGRSFKYHRPRGLVTAGSDEPNALIGVSRGPGRREPNTRATMQEIYPGLETVSQNRFPSLRRDIGAVNNALAPFFTAGFYYKTFLWPKSFWDRVYEPVIRAAAGLGQPPTELDPDHYAQRYHHCDVLVVGAGPAGLAAALAAAREGRSVTLVDEHAEPGGALLSAPGLVIDGRPAWDWLADALAELRRLGATVLPRATAIQYDHQNMVILAQRLTDHLASPPEGAPRERVWKLRAGHVVLAQGAHERPLVFKGNDLPGVMLAGAAATFLHRFGVLPGRRIAVVTTQDCAWRTAFDLAEAGTEIAAILDLRDDAPETLMDEAARRGIPTRKGRPLPRAEGGRRVARLIDGNRRIPCDCVLMAGGWTPALSLFSQSKGKLIWDEVRRVFLPGESREALTMAGACSGAWGVAAALEQGARAGGQPRDYAVAGDGGGDAAGFAAPGDGFVDFQNDVKASDIRQAVREGMRSIEHVKRYTTTGMATDQGKLSNLNALEIAAEALGGEPPQVGLTTFRPPYSPTTFGAFAGYRRGPGFEPTRKTPIDPWAEQNGAVFEPVAQWRRARYFPQDGEDMNAAVLRECAAVRAGCGIFDASTLGKIEIVGPDAAEFLNRLYTNPWTKLQPGRCRYGLLLGEDGFIRDDGVVGRMAEDRFHLTTTTGGAARVLAMMEDYLQTEWPDLRVWLTSTTERWAVIALQGPRARDVLAPHVEGLDLAPGAFPHMSVAECRVGGVPARLFRISFTGEVGFEINVPARHGLALWEKLAATPGVVPYGTETMHVLRAEKGYIIVGQDTDGTVTPEDAGMGWAIGKKKPDFVGKRSLSRPDMLATGRKQFVGLKTAHPDTVLEEGAQIVADPAQPVPMTMIGHVTSSYRSAALGRSIALALVADGRARIGETLHVPMPGGAHAVTVCDPVFYDPEGERLKA